MAIKTIQVAQTGSAVQLAKLSTFARWVLFQDAAAAAMTIGDANVTATVGYVIPATTGSLLLPALADVSQHYDLGQFWTIGTNTQNLTVVYDSMT